MILMGAGGHARILLGLIHALGGRLDGICDPELASRGSSEWCGERVLGDDSVLAALRPGSVGVVNGIGFVPGSTLRRKIQDMIDAHGHAQPILCHPVAFVDSSAQLDPGVQVMAGAVIQPETRLETAVVINTGASVDHHCVIGAGTHIAPGVTVCGGVTIGRDVFIGAGAVIAPGCSVGERAVVAAGTVIVRDVPAGVRLLGAKSKIVASLPEDQRN